MVLTEGKKDGVYRVKALRGEGDMHRHLEDMGFIPGESVNIVSRIGGNLIVSIKGSRVALSKELASNIIV